MCRRPRKLLFLGVLTSPSKDSISATRDFRAFPFFSPRACLASSKAVLMSKRTRNIVGRTTHPCYCLGSLFSCHSQCFCNKFVSITEGCWQHIFLIPPNRSPSQIGWRVSLDQHQNTRRIPLTHHTWQGQSPISFRTFPGLGI